MNPIDPATPIGVTLTAIEWNNVLAVLNEGGPYRVVAPLFAKITEQVQSAAGLLSPQPLTNGAAAHVPD